MIEQPQTYFIDLYRAGIRTAADIAKATLESVQRLQTQQAEVSGRRSTTTPAPRASSPKRTASPR